jgi:hypothetical protein
MAHARFADEHTASADLERRVLNERTPAAFCRRAIRRDVHEALKNHVIVHLAERDADATVAELAQIAANFRLAHVHAFIREFCRGVPP